MKKSISIIFCLILLISLPLSAQAATGVPEEVMNAVDSVVFITLATDAEEKYSDDELAYIKEDYPEYVFRNGSSDYVIDSSGSGFVIKNEDGETLIATNNHVVEDDHEGIFVWITDKKAVHAEVVFSSPEKDLSVIRINESINKKPVMMSTVDASRGEAVYVVGFPGAGNVLSDSLARTSDAATITDGIISAIRSSFTVVDGGEAAKILQINAAVNSGNSGGPLFNTEGEVVGINTYTVLMDSQGIFGAVAVSELWDLLERYEIYIPEETIDQPQEKEIPALSAVFVVIVLLMIIAPICFFILRKKVFHKHETVERTDTEREMEETFSTEEVSELDAVSMTKRRNVRSSVVDADGTADDEIQQDTASGEIELVSISKKHRDLEKEKDMCFTNPSGIIERSVGQIPEQHEITITKNKHRRDV